MNTEEGMMRVAQSVSTGLEQLVDYYNEHGKFPKSPSGESIPLTVRIALITLICMSKSTRDEIEKNDQIIY